MADTCTLPGIFVDPSGQPFGNAKLILRPTPALVRTTPGGMIVTPTVPDPVMTAGDGTVTLTLAPGSYSGSASQGTGGASFTFELAVPDLPTAPLEDYIGRIDVAVQTSAQLARDQAVAAAGAAGASAGQTAADLVAADMAAASALQAAGQTSLDREAILTAQAAVGIYATTTEGLAASISGQRFWVPAGEYLRLYLHTAGVAVDQMVSMPLAGVTEALLRVQAPGSYIGGLGVDRMGYAAIGIAADGGVALRRIGEEYITPGPTDPDPLVWTAPRDALGRVALGIRASGLVYANLPGDGDSGGGSALSRDAVLGMDHANVWAAEDRSATTRRYLSDVDGSTRAYVQRSDIASNTSILEDSVLHVVLSYGQSLGVGGTGDPPDAPWSVVPVNPRQSLMLSSGTVGSGSTTAWSPATATDIAPAVEVLHGPGLTQSESPVSGLLDQLVALDAVAGTRHRVYLGHAAGAGGQNIDALAVGTQPWINLLAALDRIVALAALYEMRVVVDALVWTHGEANAATDPAEYQTKLTALIAAFREACDGRSVSPAGGVPVVMDQVSSPAGSGSGRTPNVATLAIEAADPRAFVSTAKYHLTLADTVHLQAPDYRVMGEHIAKAIRSIRETGGWTGCRITGAVLAGATITLTAHVPVGALVADTAAVPAVAHHGLRYQDDAASVAIASVQVGATVAQTCTITVTLTAPPTGANPRISYAYSSAAGLPAPNFGTVGNLRDSDPMTSSVPAGDAGNGHLHNWMLICPPRPL